MYKNLSVEQRQDVLNANADGVENFSYTKKFSEEELTEKKTELTDLTIEISEIEEEKKNVASQFKDRLKPLIERQSELIKDCKYKSELVTEDVYLIADREKDIMEYFNSDGELVHSRRLTDKEKQLTIFSKVANQ